jgi:chromosome segregation ATPase
VTSLERENQQLTNDIAIAERQFDQARQGVNEADALLTQAMSSQQSSGKSPGASQPVLEARAAMNKAHSDLNSAQDHLDQLRDRSAVVVQRLTALKMQARDVTAASTASQASPSQSTPSPPSVDSPEVLATIVAWVKKNWPGMVIALLAILFLMSRFAKD